MPSPRQPPPAPLRRAWMWATLTGLALGRYSTASASATSAPPGGGLAQLLRQGGCALLLRHAATEPGVGDPPQFTLGQCHTQRNLSAQGRQQARALGERMRAWHLQPHRVLSSPWCRCLDTATLAFGSAQSWEPLGSFFTRREEGQHHARDMRTGLMQIETGRFEVWVTHMVNIEALTGEYVSSGEGLIARIERGSNAQGAVQVLGRWPV